MVHRSHIAKAMALVGQGNRREMTEALGRLHGDAKDFGECIKVKSTV